MPAPAKLWEASEEIKQGSNMGLYLGWLREHGHDLQSYEQLWEWSVQDLDAFWSSLWDYFSIRAAAPFRQVLDSLRMPGQHWFEGARLNYAEHLLRSSNSERPALLYKSEIRPLAEVSWRQLSLQVGGIARGLRRLGIRPGDRVCAYMPNAPETVAAFIATASLGGVWSSCPPEFGVTSTLARFRALEPTVLIATDGYSYGGRKYDRTAVLDEIREALPTLKQAVLLPYLPGAARPSGPWLLWTDVFAEEEEPRFEALKADHPLWILFSSGTTGPPKGIVHGHAGILLEHLKQALLHLDLTPADSFFWFTTTGWVMWNMLLGGLLAGATTVLYDGSPGLNGLGTLWDLVDEAGVTVFGAGAAYLTACAKDELNLRQTHSLERLRAIGSTGSPLPPFAYRWVYEKVKSDVWLNSISGGTEVLGALIGGTTLLPVFEGEMQCRCLGAFVDVFDDSGQPVRDKVGELVLRAPLPSMPLRFLGDPGGRRLRETYFQRFPGVWAHGDWARITARNGVVVVGRSDATINRQGIRIGSGEIYTVVEAIAGVLDSLVIDLSTTEKPRMVLFLVVSGDGTGDVVRTVKIALRDQLSPRHVPDEVVIVAEIPKTLTGKKLELPVKRILAGIPPEEAVNLGSVRNPGALRPFQEMAATQRWTTPPREIE